MFSRSCTAAFTAPCIKKMQTRGMFTTIKSRGSRLSSFSSLQQMSPIHPVPYYSSNTSILWNKTPMIQSSTSSQFLLQQQPSFAHTSVSSASLSSGSKDLVVEKDIKNLVYGTTPLEAGVMLEASIKYIDKDGNVLSSFHRSGMVSGDKQSTIIGVNREVEDALEKQGVKIIEATPAKPSCEPKGDGAIKRVCDDVNNVSHTLNSFEDLAGRGSKFPNVLESLGDACKVM
jgi:hypothetical protein